MKKLILTLVASIAAMIVILSSANAQGYNRNDIVVITQNNVPLNQIRSFEANCHVNAGTKARVIGGARGNSTYIEILDGPQRGCLGVVQNWHVAIYQEPENQEPANQEPNNQEPDLQEVFTTGNWGNDVPVFRDRQSYFNARDNDKIENVVCRLKKGQSVKFTPYKNWGVGEVVLDNCKGWIDRGVIR